MKVAMTSTERRFRRLLRTRLVVQKQAGMIETFILGRKPMYQVAAKVLNQHPTAKVLNILPYDEAFQIYTTDCE